MSSPNFHCNYILIGLAILTTTTKGVHTLMVSNSLDRSMDASEKRKHKCVHEHLAFVKTMVGKYIAMSEILPLHGKDLVGHFYDKFIKDSSLAWWLEGSWKLLFDYVSNFYVLVRGWLYFVFKSEQDYNIIPNKCYSKGCSILLLHR